MARSRGPKIGIGSLDGAIESALLEYAAAIKEATEGGIAAAADVLTADLKRSSPKDTGKYAKNWKVKQIKGKPLKRIVSNNTKVMGGRNNKIPLSNILEYSEKHGHQGEIKRTFESDIGKMTQAVIDEIKKGQEG